MLKRAGVRRLGGWLCALSVLLTSASFAASAPRIVSVGSDVTEILFGLGLGEQVVGVDTTSVYPEAVSSLPNVGYLRALSAEGILSLQPSIVVTNERAGPREVISQLERMGVEVLEIGAPNGLEGVAAKIQTIAAFFDRKPQSEPMLANLRQDTIALARYRNSIQQPKSAMFILSASATGVNAAGKQTSADSAIELIGLRNAISYVGYKAVSPEALLLSPPDVVLAMKHTVAQLGGEQGLRQLPAFSLTPMADSGMVATLDGAALLAFGPRSAAEALRLAKVLYPDADSPER